MAKAKKSKLSIEEMLVSTDLQPYEIPENWCWIHLLDSFDNVTDSKKKLATKEYLEEGAYPIIDQGQDFIGGYTDDESMIYDGELPIVIFGDHTRCMKYINFPFTQGADGVKVLKPKKFWDAKAFYYAMQSVEIPNMGYRRHYPLFKDFCIPVPPLAEQKRIVEQIENLFSKLDEAKEKLQLSIEGFDSRKIAVLQNAISGKLTVSRRKQHGTNPEWECVPLGKVIKLLSGQDFKPEQYNDISEGMPYITGASNFEGNHVIINRWTQTPTVIAKTGDVLVVCKGSGYGKTIIADFDEAHIARQVMAIRVNDEVLNRYVFYSLQANYEYIRECGQGLIPGIARNVILNMPFMLPSLEEQEIIVATVEKIIKKEQHAKEEAEQVLEQIDLMKKSILAKAFHGELGTNIPDEESSLELLKQILD